MTQTRVVFPGEVLQIEEAHNQSQFHTDAELAREAKILRACIAQPASPEILEKAVTLTGRVHTCMDNNRVDAIADAALSGDKTAAAQAKQLQKEVRFDTTNLGLLGLATGSVLPSHQSYDLADLCYDIGKAFFTGDHQLAKDLIKRLNDPDRVELCAMLPDEGTTISHYMDNSRIVMQFLERRTGNKGLTSDQSLEDFFGGRA
ncbi:MAG: hypothetical protein SP1CHLAM54_05320 [Chlamydiia bacterium]|nr:hypothetical protein [Chlamydiia bacterium]MCH9615444.1 hypothetical protein [Chlamydiia bacterium]MCH9628234.1 hypothetical protein [Chlamydiia bacterium]